MTTTMKIALSPMTVFDSSLTIPEMFDVYNRLNAEGLKMGHAITYTKSTVNGCIKYVVNTVRKDGKHIVLDITEHYDDGSEYNRTMFVTEFLNWIFD